jgi:hypothetical protein
LSNRRKARLSKRQRKAADLSDIMPNFNSVYSRVRASLAQQAPAGAFMNDSINDNLPSSRPGYAVLLGAIIVVAGMFAIILFRTAVI